MKKYKLTTQDLQTYGGFQWEIGKEVTTTGKEDYLCNSSWLHYYHHPLLAVLLNPIHSDIIEPRLFEVKAEGKHLDDNGLKGGCTKMTLIKELTLPVITLTQKVAFGILCSLMVYKNKKYVTWANNWLLKKDRTYSTAAAAYAAADITVAYATANAAAKAAYAAADITVAYAAANAAKAAAEAAYAAAKAANANADITVAYANAANAANAAANAANAAAYAAYAAADITVAYATANAAAKAANAAVGIATIDLIKIAKKALKY